MADWWPELAPRIETSRAPRHRGLCVDAHTHLSVKPAAAVAKPFFRPEFEPRAVYSSEETTRYNTEYRASPLNTAQFEDAEQRLADMDAQGVDMQVLSVPPTEYFYWLPEAEALRANRLQHERFAEVVAQWPDRFAAVANVPMDHPALAVEMLREARRDYGFGGVEISADVLGRDLDDRRFDPVWEAVVELDMTVILHPQGFTHGERFTDYYLVNVMCMPLASTLAVTRMILGGVWSRHPGSADDGRARRWLSAVLHRSHRPCLAGAAGDASSPRRAAKRGASLDLSSTPTSSTHAWSRSWSPTSAPITC